MDGSIRFIGFKLSVILVTCLWWVLVCDSENGSNLLVRRARWQDGGDGVGGGGGWGLEVV